MIVGVPREIKSDEYRVALRPVGARLLTEDGHQVWVQSGAGLGSGISDEAYVEAGARLVPSASELYRRVELVLKVKEPQAEEIAQLQPHHIVFGYFHFASSLAFTQACLTAGFTALAYETLTDARGALPLLTPMSEVAGRLSIQSGAKFLERPNGGRGVLLGGVPGVEPGNVLVLGAGVVGTHAAQIAAGFGANVQIMDVNLERLRTLDTLLPANVTTLYSDPEAIANALPWADLVVGAVLLPGRRAPKLISRRDLSRMKAGSVIVDVCIDQGGCAESSRPTTHAQPTYIESGVVHYCVTNMPGAVGRTSTHALCNATLPYIRQLAQAGTEGFISKSVGHRLALNLRQGQIENPDVAAAIEGLAAELPLSAA
jgi:alanine dehydrogenase